MPEDDRTQGRPEGQARKDPTAEQKSAEEAQAGKESAGEEKLEDLPLGEEDAEVTERVRGGRRTRAISIPY